MLKFEKIVETTTSRMSSISLNQQRCSKIRSHLSRCSKCIDYCPVNGLDLEKSEIKLNDNCIQCGLCASVCPTGAIFIQEPTELSGYSGSKVHTFLKFRAPLSGTIFINNRLF